MEHIFTAVLAVACELAGLWYTLLAIRVGTEATGLPPKWKTDLRTLRRRLTRKKPETIVARTARVPGAGRSRHGRGTAVVISTPEDVSLEARVEALEKNLAKAQASLRAETERRWLAIRTLSLRVSQEASGSKRAVKQLERSAARADREALDYQLTALLWVAVGVVFSVITAII